ncbi:MAG: TonB-dependent receptor [Alphaproteobacteria bacterium]|nr:TonB-dependent receptor [Alphaproteobacteria bacterium]MDE2162477.1 TonB-dependent receptor [Alphaproteobacteria bacterium]MDE2265364.1 TonB-dependent receptor [Alphaproteobacteria bacterium]MDE2498549.1 TonB-dependent receptor [Alphaproteobacteria bacterium]
MLKTTRTRAASSRLKLSASAVALLTVMGTGAAFAQDTGSGAMETVVVTGFRESLEKALDIKRNALDSSDTIMAEDIAKFPDLNLSESLQRIPGVNLARDAGEGRQISVRGLDPTFTRVRINGMEALATTGSEDASGGTNRGRGFDFNVFASDLFSQLTVHKSSSANLEEGSLGATVDLYTGHPFDHPGFVFTTSAQYGYQDLPGSSNPRVVALVSDTFLGGRLGVMVSGAYAIQNTLENGISTVRWQNDNTAQNATHSSPGVTGCVTVPGATSNCSASQRFKSVGGATSGTAYDLVNEAFHPRFPRYDNVQNHEKRLGLTGSIQWQPDDDTLFTLDGLFADFAVVRQEYYLEAESFSNNYKTSTLGTGLQPTLGIQNIDILDYYVDTTRNNMTYAKAAGVGLRSEHRLDHLDTRFEQLTLDATHSFSESFKIHGLLGWSESHHRNPVQTTLTFDYNCTAADAGGSTANCPGGAAGGAGTSAKPYMYDYRVGDLPAISYGNVDVTSSTGWFLSQIRERAAYNNNAYRTVQGDFKWDYLKSIQVEGGFDYRNFGYSTADLRRSNGGTGNLDSSIPTAVETAALSGYTQLITMKGLNAPSGTPMTWMVPDLQKANALFGIWDPTAFTTTGTGACASGCGAFHLGPEPSLSNNGSVKETDYAGWLQVDWDTLFYGVPFRGNIGGRYILTETESIGFSYDPIAKAVVAADIKQTYHDILPALNAVFEPADDFLVRINAGYTMARPGLTNMLPGGTASKSGSNLTANVRNPYLKPFRSKNVDLSFEWYYHKGALLSIAVFYKHIDSLVQTLTDNIVFHGNPYGLPDSLAVAACGTSYGAACNENLVWTFQHAVNTTGSPLYGTEIDWQQPFDFLPNPFDNFGFLGNVTFVKAQQTYYNSNGTVFVKADLNGLSNTSYNATLYYDDTVFQARVTAAFRSKYIVSGGVNPGNLNDVQINNSTFNLDASSSYKFDENFTITLDALNLTNQAQQGYVDTIGQRPYYWHQTGSEYFIGLRYNY